MSDKPTTRDQLLGAAVALLGAVLLGAWILWAALDDAAEAKLPRVRDRVVLVAEGCQGWSVPERLVEYMALKEAGDFKAARALMAKQRECMQVRLVPGGKVGDVLRVDRSGVAPVVWVSMEGVGCWWVLADKVRRLKN